ncbi:hypothetical protein [Halosolutus halophilus]|nr:hypothetical protein [Halosolutus halophilus]
MDSKRPDVRVDDRPDEEGRVTHTSDESDRSLVDRLLSYLRP